MITHYHISMDNVESMSNIVTTDKEHVEVAIAALSLTHQSSEW